MRLARGLGQRNGNRIRSLKKFQFCGNVKKYYKKFKKTRAEKRNRLRYYYVTKQEKNKLKINPFII